MNNKRVVIDSGHGGTDGGASGNGILEKNLTLEISEYIHNRLDELDIENSMTRTTDETLEPNERINRIKSFYGDGSDVLLISNHINAGGGEGAEVIYALRNNDTFSRKIANELENTGREVRKIYQRRYPYDSTKDYYYIHRNTGNIEPVIIEYGFLDNKTDANLLKNYYQDYAEAVVKAISEYLGVPYQPTGEIQNPNYYIVRKGDTLYSIANKNNISVDKLKQINNLTNNNLYIGQKLLVVDTSSSEDIGVYYTVKSGDTLYGIAKQYNISVDELKNLNNLTNNTLSIGEKLLVSGTANIPNTSDYDTYIVTSGDTLWSIANKFNTNVNNLKDINNLSSNLLSIGEQLLIPKQLNIPKTYTVQSGDTLYKIAQNNGTTVTDIVNLNNLPTTNLSIGQILQLP